MGWLFVPELEVSSSDFGWDLENGTEPSVTWRGKPMPLRRLKRAWRTQSWMRRLSGVTLPHSMADVGVGRLISSLRVSRASHSAQRASNSGQQTNAGSGQRSPAWFARWDRGSSSWRTSQSLLFTGSGMYSEAWPRSGSMRSGTCSARRESEPRTSAGGCSFSREEYPTPRLETWAKRWTTPVASDAHRGLHGGGHGNLSRDVARWPTPVGSPNENRTTKPAPGGRRTLAGEACQHSGPATWPTPRACGGKKTSGAPRSEYYRCSPQDLTTCTHGKGCRKSLNPRFVEALMGFPIGWTDCEPLATESFRSWLREHSTYLEGALG